MNPDFRIRSPRAGLAKPSELREELDVEALDCSAGAAGFRWWHDCDDNQTRQQVGPMIGISESIPSKAARRGLLRTSCEQKTLRRALPELCGELEAREDR